MLYSAARLAAASLFLASAAYSLAESVDPASLCDEPGDKSESEIAAISNVQLHRGPLDLEGARLVGCLHNHGDESLQNLMLEYSWVQERGGGGGNTNLEFAPIPAGEARPFMSGPFTRDADHYERWQTTGLRLTNLEVFMVGEYPLDPVRELPLPLLDRPAHPIEEACANLDTSDHEGPILISQAEFGHIGPPGARTSHVIGCVSNLGDEIIADDRRHEIRVSYSSRHGQSPERMGMGGGSGSLRLEAPLAPGESAFFISSFNFDSAIVEVDIEPGGMREVDGVFEFVASGPKVRLEQSGFEP